MPNQSGQVRRETFDDARRLAYLCAAHTSPCELTVHDAYHRVLHHKLIDGKQNPPTGSPPTDRPRPMTSVRDSANSAAGQGHMLRSHRPPAGEQGRESVARDLLCPRYLPIERSVMPQAIARWGPFAELSELRTDCDRMSNAFTDGAEGLWTPAIDVVREESLSPSTHESRET